MKKKEESALKIKEQKMKNIKERQAKRKTVNSEESFKSDE